MRPSEVADRGAAQVADVHLVGHVDLGRCSRSLFSVLVASATPTRGSTAPGALSLEEGARELEIPRTQGRYLSCRFEEIALLDLAARWPAAISRGGHARAASSSEALRSRLAVRELRGASCHGVGGVLGANALTTALAGELQFFGTRACHRGRRM